VRDQAADVLTRWSSSAVARRLVESLTNPDLSRNASELLTRMGPSAVEPLVEVLLREPGEMMSTVGALLNEITGPDQFLELLQSLDPVERLRAVEALGAMGGPRAMDGLMRNLSDPDERIRVRVLQHLGRLRDRRAYEAVKRTYMGDPVLEVVHAAEEALRNFEDPDTRPGAGPEPSSG
jgi:HEAT repeat protein